jgi:hypothetical protein
MALESECEAVAEICREIQNVIRVVLDRKISGKLSGNSLPLPGPINTPRAEN